MERTYPYQVLYRGLGKPVSEQYDGAYRRVRWSCGCVASGLNAQRLLVRTCVRHRRLPLTEAVWLRR